jgi:hypothetical protein
VGAITAASFCENVDLVEDRNSQYLMGGLECPFLGERGCKNRVDSIEILSFNGLKALYQEGRPPGRKF